MATKKDYLLVSIIGFFFALLLMVVFQNVRPPFWTLSFFNAAFLVVGFVIFANIALWIAGVLGKKFFFLWQFAKFGAAGALNTMLDLGILNALILWSGIASGMYYAIFKAVSFIVATFNGYLWNKYWTFQAATAVNIREYGKYFIISAGGLAINVGSAAFVVNVIGPLWGIGPELWANIGALSALVISLIWNFLGYKFIVFKTVRSSVEN